MQKNKLMQNVAPQTSWQSLFEEQVDGQTKEPKETSLLDPWYRFTAPPQPSQQADFSERETARRGRLLSLWVLLVTIIVLFAVPEALVTHNLPMLSSLVSALVFNAITLWLNQRKQVIAAGLLTVIPMTIGFALGLFLTPGGLTLDTVRIFDLLVASELLVVSVFPPASVFLAAICNSILIWTIVSFAPHSQELEHALMINRYGIIVLPILLQFAVAFPTYLLVRSAYRALQRADTVSLLEREMVKQARIIGEQSYALSEQKQQLEYGIQQILQTHVRAAQGDFSVRAPRTQDNVLWQIAISLNTLLARLQQARQVELEMLELRAMKQEVTRIAQTLVQASWKERMHSSSQSTTTSYERLIRELNVLVHTRHSTAIPSPSRHLSARRAADSPPNIPN